MRFLAILNRDGGSLRTLDIEEFAAGLKSTLTEHGHTVTCAIVSGKELMDALERAARQSDCDAVIVGGGDGTVSAAAGALMGSDKALAVLPAGTMNLFARSLGIPLDLEEAIEAFGSGRLRKADVASANDRAFVHQFSIGMHPKLITLREKRSFASRLGKIRASAQAGLDTLFNPPRMRVALKIDGQERAVTTSSLGITNNLFGEGHLPYADQPDGGVLGIYVTKARRRRDYLMFGINIALGRWRANEQVDIHTAREVEVRVIHGSRRFGCSIDGELCDLADVTELRIHPQALNVLVPAGEQD
jgi:diacylglycerol kinase family enzyme